MDDQLYDEFGNYIGPDLEEEQEEEQQAQNVRAGCWAELQWEGIVGRVWWRGCGEGLLRCYPHGLTSRRGRRVRAANSMRAGVQFKQRHYHRCIVSALLPPLHHLVALQEEVEEDEELPDWMREEEEGSGQQAGLSTSE